MNITRYEPRYRPLGLLDRLLQEDSLGDLLRANSEPDLVSDWRPAVDIREEEESYVLQADLPGVNPDDIEVTMDKGILTIKGQREHETEDEQPGYHRYERVAGSFMRRFTLPDTTNGDEISATTRHGVLMVTIPKQAKPQPRKINVRSS